MWEDSSKEDICDICDLFPHVAYIEVRMGEMT